MHPDLLLFIPLFFGIALVYAQVGFGGGSSYLALLSLCSWEYALIKTTALICNIVVVSGGTYFFYKNGFISFKKTLPLILCSVPFAYWGGTLQLNEALFFVLLGFSLLAAAILMWINPTVPSKNPRPHSSIWNMLLGTGIGFLSGVVGIGGGVFLAPCLHLSHWAKAKVIAGTASLFILLNSIAGLVGQIRCRTFEMPWLSISCLMIAVFWGGQIGSRLGTSYLKADTVKKWTGILIGLVGLRILLKTIL